jgi:4a-hydroxytetrahydrobiopterin dehydratase
MNKLLERRCVACTSKTPRLDPGQVRSFLAEVPGFASDDSLRVSRLFEFRDFSETMLFVNAVAWIAAREDHHPDLEVTYKTCRVTFTTHAIGGLSENDFICAAKVNALVG